MMNCDNVCRDIQNWQIRHNKFIKYEIWIHNSLEDSSILILKKKNEDIKLMKKTQAKLVFPYFPTMLT
jgi:hypothetical protein